MCTVVTLDHASKKLTIFHIEILSPPKTYCMSTNVTLPLGINHFISLDNAKEMTSRFREHRNDILVPELREMNILSICETFDRGAFDTVLAETGCLGIRVYFGMTPELKVRVIVV